MRGLNGQYTTRGIAEDQLAVLETLSRYQDAINLFNEGIEHLTVPNSPIQVKVVGLAGSFAHGRGRLGVYQDLTFDAVHEMQSWGKIFTRSGSHGYGGIHWSGYLCDIFWYPSDLDILIDYKSQRATSLKENWNVNDATKELSRSIFESTGVYVHATTNKLVGEYIPLENIVGNGFIKSKTPLEKVA